MTQFILVHGACHGAWCWRDVVPALEALGHQAKAIDLPGRGGGIAGLSLADQAEAILSAYEGEAVLVGHSAGGFAISAAAEDAPERVSRLIYVAALAPRDGDVLGRVMQGLTGPRADLPLVVAEDRLSYCFDLAGAGPVLYNGASQEVIDWALPQITFEPSAPHREAIRLGAAFAGVAKSYVVCTEDRMIPEEDQQRMAAGMAEIAAIDTGHSPFLSEPDALARDLVHLAVT
ncbi:alpha/beta fold hydrolase [Pseudooceanicola sp.]|uniref:alpha/beta fold hydrolase n=1 Tax=Pseudooceanicola sp. TaxID=1914328 RepID=UPI0035C7115F